MSQLWPEGATPAEFVESNVVRRGLGLPGLTRMCKSQLVELARVLLPEEDTSKMTVLQLQSLIRNHDSKECQKAAKSGDKHKPGSSIPACLCGLPAIAFVVAKDNQNYGRLFWTCRKEKDQRCEYFAWHDLLFAEQPLTTASGARSSPPALAETLLSTIRSLADMTPSGIQELHNEMARLCITTAEARLISLVLDEALKFGNKDGNTEDGDGWQEVCG